MPERFIRFGIRDEMRRAATWKLWTRIGTGKSDLYLACRRLGGTLKASLHESGYWHIAYTQEAFEKYLEGIGSHTDRFIHKWPRPESIGDGMILAFQIITPHGAVTSPITEKDKGVLWIPNAPEPQATEIAIVLTSPEIHLEGWPGKQSMGTDLVSSFELEDGHKVWVVYRIVNMPSLPTEVPMRFFKGRGPKDLDTDALRAIFIKKTDGSQVIYDIPVKKVEKD